MPCIATPFEKCCGFQNEKNCAMDREQYVGIHVDTDNAGYICNEGVHRAFCLVVASLCSTSLKKKKKDANCSKPFLIPSCCPSLANDATPDAIDTLN